MPGRAALGKAGNPAASRRLDARLVILLANHIGDEAVLREAIALARAAGKGVDAEG